MNENDRNLVQFLWFDDMHRENPSSFKYCFTGLVFGLTCSPFVLNATVHHHLTKNIDVKKIKHVIERVILNLCVNDCTTSFDMLSDAIQLYHIAKSILDDANFDLQKSVTSNFVTLNLRPLRIH